MRRPSGFLSAGVLVSLLFIPVAALAQNAGVSEGATDILGGRQDVLKPANSSGGDIVPSGKVELYQDQPEGSFSKLLISREDCLRLLPTFETDPSAEYKPGIDANGNEVTSADLNPQQVTVPETFEIPIEVDLQQFLGLPASVTQFTDDLKVGTVTVDREGRPSFNGQPLYDQGQAELEAACLDALAASSKSKKEG